MEKPSLTDVLLGRPATATREVAGRQIEFRILTNPERVEIWRRYPTQDLVSAPEAIAIPTIARAIIAIDGMPWEQFKEIQELRKAHPESPIYGLAEKHLSENYPFLVINELYVAYAEVVNEFQLQLDELKKRSSTRKLEPSGEFVKPSEKTQ